MAWAAVSDMDPSIVIPATLIGGGLALTSHGTKATARIAANLSPEPVSNWILSIFEDVLAIGGALLAWMLVLKITGQGIGYRPAFLTGILFVVVSVQLMTLGLLAELIVHFRRDREPELFVDADANPRGQPLTPPR